MHEVKTTSGASNTRPAGHKWPAKGFKVARQRFLHWLVDWCFRAVVVSCRNESLNFLLGEWNLRRNLLRRNPSEWPFFFFDLHLLCGRKNRSNLSEDLFFGDHHEINPKTLVWEVEDKLRLNFGPSNFCNSKFSPRLKKVDAPGVQYMVQLPLLTDSWKCIPNHVVQGRPTFFSRGLNLLLQKFDRPKFSLSLSSTSQTKVLGLISWWSPKKKGLHADLIGSFCHRAGEDQKKKKRSFRWISPEKISPKISFS